MQDDTADRPILEVPPVEERATITLCFPAGKAEIIAESTDGQLLLNCQIVIPAKTFKAQQASRLVLANGAPPAGTAALQKAVASVPELHLTCFIDALGEAAIHQIEKQKQQEIPPCSTT